MTIPDFELPVFDPKVMRDPYPWYREMRAIGRVVRNPSMLGGVMIGGYEEALAVLSDHRTFSSAAIGSRDRSGAFEGPIMLNSDPPDHERLRGVVARAFTPRAVSGLEPWLREITDELVEPLRSGEPYDVVQELAYPLPVLAISELLGVPGEDRESFRRWSNDLIAGNPELADEEALARGRRGAESLKEYFREVIARRRVEPGTDLVSKLVAANEGAVLDDAELLSACVLLLVAGNETTTNLISNMALALARHPDQRRLVAATPDLATSATLEVLRYDSPVQATARMLVRDATIGGHDLPAGEMIMVFIGAANRDPAQFERPDTLDVTREASQHLGFGHGIHYCLGAGLARLESRIALEVLLAAAPDYELACDVENLDYGASFIFHSPKSLTITAKR